MTDQPISFDEAPATAGTVTCSRCGRDLAEYWAIDGAVLCGSCKDAILAEQVGTGSGLAPFLKATLFGIGGMLVGAAAWAAIEFFAGYQLALIAILLGYLVGKGVHRGSGGRGGIRYQVLALAITWVGYGLASTPTLVREMLEPSTEFVDTASTAATVSDSSATAAPLAPIEQMNDSARDAELASLDSAITAGKKLDDEAGRPGWGMIIATVAGLVLTLPFLAVFQGGSFILGIIYAIGLYEAWKHTRATARVVSGPHPVGAGTA